MRSLILARPVAPVDGLAVFEDGDQANSSEDVAQHRGTKLLKEADPCRTSHQCGNEDLTRSGDTVGEVAESDDER